MQNDNIMIACPCCGEEVEITIRRSNYIPDEGLDMKPIGAGRLPKIYECPSCHYCSPFLDGEIEPEVEAVVRSQFYQDSFKQAGDPEKRRFLSAIRLAPTMRLAMDLWMVYCWYLEFNGEMEEAAKARENAVAIQEEYIKENQDFDVMMQRMDSLRQLGRMEEALDMIPLMKPLVNPQENPHLVKMLIFEKKAILNGDRAPHMESEVE